MIFKSLLIKVFPSIPTDVNIHSYIASCNTEGEYYYVYCPHIGIFQFCAKHKFDRESEVGDSVIIHKTTQGYCFKNITKNISGFAFKWLGAVY